MQEKQEQSEKKPASGPEPQENQDFRHLVRIMNTDLKGEKQIGTALRGIKGINFMFANMLCALAAVDKTKKAGNLSEEEVKKIEKVMEDTSGSRIPVWMLNRRKDYESGKDKHILTGDLDFTQDNDIKRMKMIKCYKGMRHARGLTVRGQKTKANFRRNKGKVAGVKRKSGKSGRI
ncbi:30S ribosomal protein S13 [Candidatus Woesearchaeota archaeon]|nr:30S ribosomal protein S13 [Candidatus Woesearchaeota archaeon]